MRVRQSTLKQWAKCPLIYKHSEIDGLVREQSGSLTYGSILHDCVLWMEVHQDVEGAVRRFKELWLAPTRLDPTYAVDYYVKGTSWKRFMDQGPLVLRNWWSIIRWDSALTLAREYTFEVPIGQDGNTLFGTVDKLEIRFRAEINSYVVQVVDYKGLALDTRLATPTGWTTMRDIRIGEQVIGGDGEPCTVVAKSERHLRDCYRITFDDSSSVVADNEHLWEVHTDGGVKILATEELAKNLVNPTTGQRHLRIPNVTTELPAAALPIDPYVLGAWLGDGAAATGRITKPLPALFQEIERRGYAIGPNIGAKDRCETHTIFGLRSQLRRLGLLENKHLPDLYLRASWSQRLDVLRGIMDTDGHWNSVRKRCVVNTTNEQFARQINELVVSLGWKATTFATTANGFGKVVPAWQTWFTPDQHVFLARRPDDFRADMPTRSGRRLIRSVEPVPTVETQCIAVDSPENTYLCGEQMVKTHNTDKKTPTYAYLADDLQFSAYCFATTRPEFWANLPRGPELFAQYQALPRYGEWVQLTAPRRMDAGIREQRHYNRIAMAADALAQSVAMRIFVPNISGETCRWCEFRKPCGLPLLDENGHVT